MLGREKRGKKRREGGKWREIDGDRDIQKDMDRDNDEGKERGIEREKRGER